MFKSGVGGSPFAERNFHPHTTRRFNRRTKEIHTYKNNVDLVGFIGSDPEAHQTSNGIAVTNFSLATKSSWKKEDGSYDSRTEWHRIVLWGKLDDAAAKLAKGAYVQVEGELRHRSYQKEVPAGKKAVAVDIPVTEVHARILRKLERSTTSTKSEVTEEAPE